MKITYDKEVDAMYLYFKKGKIKKTIRIGKYFIADLDKGGEVLGLEILVASRKISGKKTPYIIVGNKSLKLPAFSI